MAERRAGGGGTSSVPEPVYDLREDASLAAAAIRRDGVGGALGV